MFKKIENKIKEIAGKINKSNTSNQDEIYNNAKKIYELAVIYKFLSKNKSAHEIGDVTCMQLGAKSFRWEVRALTSTTTG